MELENLVVRLALDAAKYSQGLTESARQTAAWATTVRQTTQDATGQLQKTEVMFRSFGETAKSAGGGAKAFGGQVKGLAMELGLLYGLGAVVGMVKDFSAASLEAARTQNDAKNALTGLVGSSDKYRDAVQQVKEATRGTVSETEAARTAFGLLDNGIAKTAEEAAQYALAGKALNSALGNTASYEKFLMLLDEGSPMLLNNFNITGSMIDAQQRLVEANTNLTGSEARLQAVREVALAKGLALADTISQETIAAQQATAAFADFQASFGQLVIALDGATGTTSFLTSAFQHLTEGAEAWRVIIEQQIPAIAAHNASVAEQAATAAIGAKSQEELAAAWEQGRTDFDGFTSALVNGTNSVEQYNDIIKQGAGGNYLLAQSLTLTAEGYDSARQAVATAAAEAVVSSGQWVSSLAAMDMPINQVISDLEKLASFSETTFAITTGALDAQSARWQGLANASRTMTGGHGVLETMAGGETFTAPEAKAAEEQQKAAEKAAKAAGKAMTSAFSEAANTIVSTIESVIQPSLSEVWSPPEGAEIHIDEAARQLATVATSGFGSEWLGQLDTQFAGMEFWQPITEAMQSGDATALQGAATDILTQNVTALWDVEAIKAAVRQQLQQQNLRDQIIEQVRQELAAEGMDVGADQIAAVASDAGAASQTATQTAQGFTDAGAAVTGMGEDFAGVQGTLTDMDTLLKTINTATIPPLIKKVGEFSTALSKAATSGITASQDITTSITELTVSIQTTLKEVDWSLLGKNIMAGIKQGIDKNRHLVLEALKDLAKDAISAAESQLGIHSPSTVFADIGNQLVMGLVQGVTAGSPQFQAAFDKLFNIDRSVLNINNSIGAARDEVEDMLESFMDDEHAKRALKILGQVFRDNSAAIMNATDKVAKFKELVGKVDFGVGEAGQKGINAAFGLWIHHVEEMQKEAKNQFQAMLIAGARQAIELAGKLNGLAQSGIDRVNQDVASLYQMLQTGAAQFDWEGQIISNTQAQQLYNEALAEQLAAQEEIAALQKNQADLAFLQQQLDLMEQARAAGLNMADIFGGLEFGLNASLPDLIAATNAVVQAMIDQVNSDLEIASPSKVMAKIGQRVMEGLAQGISGAVTMPVGAMSGAVQQVTNNAFTQNIFSSGGPGNAAGEFSQMRARYST
jgi:hypothetical protein